MIQSVLYANSLSSTSQACLKTIFRKCLPIRVQQYIFAKSFKKYQIITYRIYINRYTCRKTSQQASKLQKHISKHSYKLKLLYMHLLSYSCWKHQNWLSCGNLQQKDNSSCTTPPIFSSIRSNSHIKLDVPRWHSSSCANCMHMSIPGMTPPRVTSLFLPHNITCTLLWAKSASHVHHSFEPSSNINCFHPTKHPNLCIPNPAFLSPSRRQGRIAEDIGTQMTLQHFVQYCLG